MDYRRRDGRMDGAVCLMDKVTRALAATMQETYYAVP